MVDRAALEMQCTARYRGFESLSLRQIDNFRGQVDKWASGHVGKGLSLSDEVAPLPARYRFSGASGLSPKSSATLDSIASAQTLFPSGLGCSKSGMRSAGIDPSGFTKTEFMFR